MQPERPDDGHALLPVQSSTDSSADERSCAPSHGQRLENLQAVLQWVSQLGIAEVLVVEQDRESRLPSGFLPPGCKSVFVFNDGPFNKSWGFNIGFKQSSGDVLAFGDADILIDSKNLIESFALSHAGADAVNPYDRLIDLTAEETSTFLQSGKGLDALAHRQKANREAIGEFLCFCGGLFVIRRNAFEALGGFDERFVGWGGEDDAMSIKLDKLVPNTRVLVGQAAYHLFHERQRARLDGHSHYAQNVALLKQYHSASADALRSFSANQRKTIGHLDRYRQTTVR